MFEENTGLIYSGGKAFSGTRGGDGGSVPDRQHRTSRKAVDKFDMSYDVKFSHLCRSHDHRRDQTLSQGRRDTEGKPFSEGKPLQDLSGERSTDTPAGAGTYDGEMAEEMGISIEELVMTMESGAEVESLQQNNLSG